MEFGVWDGRWERKIDPCAQTGSLSREPVDHLEV